MERAEDRKTYKIEEAARLLGIGRNQAYLAAKTGELPIIKMGARLLVPKAALDRMLAGEAA
jgi:excisionase family DNA binding protein